MKSSYSSSRLHAGFSLVEMLTVVAVIGVMAAIASLALGGLNESAADTKDLQNARLLAIVCQSAQAAGVDFVDADGDLQVTIQNIQAGGVGSEGAFEGQVFRVPIAESEIPGASRYLAIQSGLLVFLKE